MYFLLFMDKWLLIASADDSPRCGPWQLQHGQCHAMGHSDHAMGHINSVDSYLIPSRFLYMAWQWILVLSLSLCLSVCVSAGSCGEDLVVVEMSLCLSL